MCYLKGFEEVLNAMYKGFVDGEDLATAHDTQVVPERWPFPVQRQNGRPHQSNFLVQLP